VRVDGWWTRSVMYRLAGGQWVAEPLPTTAKGEPVDILLDLSVLDTGHALVSSYNSLMVWGYANDLPSNPAADPGRPDVLYFAVTRHTLRGSLRAAWERDGGLPVFGYPLTEQFAEPNADTGAAYATQYLERQRFEYHPEHAGTPFEVLLGRLGVEALAAQGRPYQSFPKANPAAPHYFAATGQAIAPEFWDYWRGSGLDLGQPGVSEGESLALFGYPISPAQVETNADGDQVLTQWFERARFEFHPANPPGQRVLLGRLGAEALALRGWIGR
ncbi:MAG TPA: hypothetical protein VGE07_18020, partial [Herpetosiphonaceae bacterium]